MLADWRPSCDLNQLRRRAELLAEVRNFFARKDVLEVETPLLCGSTGTDPQLAFFRTEFDLSPRSRPLFLQTSPEFAMKRLLAAGIGSIFQICKAFRNSESGRFHNPEFTILEWYRIDFRLPELMEEVAELLMELLRPAMDLQQPQLISYQTIFIEQTGLDPLNFQLERYCQYAVEHAIPEAIDICGDDPVLWLDFIFSHKIQPELGHNAVCLVYGYPAVQSSLARINEINPLIAERFEVFVQGVELGNGFFELEDAGEQEKRFDKENAERELMGLPTVNKDRYFLASLRAGLPDCSGVAIGLDRVLMLLTGARSINDVLAFPVDRA